MPARLKHALRSTGSAASGDRTPPPGVPEDPPLGGPETPPLGGPETPPPDGPEDPPPRLGWPLMPADPIAQAEDATVLRAAREGILTLDATGRMVTCNPAFRRLTGFGLSDLSPAPLAVLLSPRNPPDLADRVRKALETFARWQGRCWLRHAEGHDRAVWLSATVARDTRGAVQRYIGLFTDLSHPGADPGSLPFTHRLDPLTRLPDREALCEALALRLRTQRGGFTLALIDLDRFARINDARGRNVGDRLLRRVAARILARAGRSAYVARTGGNDFALVLEAPQAQAAETVRQVTSALQGGIDLDGERFHLPASAGLASATLDGTTPENLLEAAEAALHHAKAEGRGRVVAIDDFGTGCSSLARLKTLPVDIFKLDRAFVSGLPDDAADAGLCRAVLDIARHLGLEVVAEGIETPAQRDWLRDAGCPLAQGYALGRPVPPEVFAATWLRRGAGHRPSGGPA